MHSLVQNNFIVLPSVSLRQLPYSMKLFQKYLKMKQLDVDVNPPAFVWNPILTFDPYGSWDMNYWPGISVQSRTDRQMDRQTDRKRCLWAQCAIAQVGSNILCWNPIYHTASLSKGTDGKSNQPPSAHAPPASSNKLTDRHYQKHYLPAEGSISGLRLCGIPVFHISSIPQREGHHLIMITSQMAHFTFTSQ